MTTSADSIAGGRFDRAATVDRAPTKRDDRRVRLAMSSEAPVDRWFGTEILGHQTGEVRLDFFNSGRAPVLLGHNPDRHIGVVERVDLGNDGVLRGTVRLGSAPEASQALADIRDGIKVNASIGYQIHRIVRAEGGSDDAERFRAIDWEPLEVSMVAIPADKSVGVGRVRPAVPSRTAFKREQVMEDEMNVLDPVEAERQRAGNIMALAQRRGMLSAGSRAVQEGWSLDQFRNHVLASMPAAEPVQRRAPETDGGGAREWGRMLDEYRVTRAIAAQMDPKYARDAVLELEVHEELKRQHPSKPKGILVPRYELQQREMTIGGTGGQLKETSVLGDRLVDPLRPVPVVRQLGATIIDGVYGALALPRVSSGTTAAWITNEGDEASSTDATFEQISMDMKRAGAYTQFTRDLILQASIAVEDFVRMDLRKAMAQLIDFGALQGSGSSGQPTGLINQSGINRGTFAADYPTWDEVVELITLIASDNALMGSLAYVMDAAMRGSLMTTEKATGTAQFILDEGGRVATYRALMSNNVPAGDLIFGNWSDLVIALWGAQDIIVDPYTLSTRGKVRVSIFENIDIAIRHPESFAVGNNAASAG